MFINIIKQTKVADYFIIEDDHNNTYILQILTLDEYQRYNDLIKYSNKIKKAIHIEKMNNVYHLYFIFEDKTEYGVKSKLTSKILLEIFEKTSYELALKKEQMKNLNNIYKLLDNKFNYFELRIREIELNPIKRDIDWIILSKYYILLDAKVSENTTPNHKIIAVFW